LVERIARGAGLDPALAWGVMEAESGLDPGVTSPVGARGLMQLMPEVGARLHAGLLQGNQFDADRLYDGRTNAFLGTSELARLAARYRDRLGGDPAPAVVAAYNAGQEAVDRWLEQSDGDPAAFADDIPWTETRRYVRRVLSVALDLRRTWGIAPP
jgi:soluble lytic murein transglycosylase